MISQARQFSTWYCSVKKSSGLLSQQRRTCNSSSSTVRKTLAACKYKHPTSRHFPKIYDRLVYRKQTISLEKNCHFSGIAENKHSTEFYQNPSFVFFMCNI